MFPTADIPKLIWHILASTGTLIIFLLLAYELVRSGSLANAKRGLEKRWLGIDTSNLAELDHPWMPLDGNWDVEAVPPTIAAFSLKPHPRTK